MTPIAPGATIGILGGGQLGRMTAMAARTLGYNVHVLDPDANCAAGAVADRVVAAKFNDADATDDLARHCDVVTVEIEQIGPDALAAAQRHAPVRPSPRILHIIQDRARQKAWLNEIGAPIGAYRDVRSADDLRDALHRFGPVFLKACHGGYDGRRQARVMNAGEIDAVWSSMGERHSIAEQALDLDVELSIMVARRPSGEMKVFPPALNYHERQILSWSVLPAPLPREVISEAESIARSIAGAFELEGILAVEMFLLADGQLLVNELAPRPHNSFHETEVACATSQFEQLVRAVCDLPLGDTTALRAGAIYNLFGELWERGDPAFDTMLAHPGVRLHLYGKRGARAGRKMGHLSATAGTPKDALDKVLAAAATLTGNES